MNGGYIPDIPPMYSKRLDQMIKQCMAIDPEKRPTAKELFDLAQYYLEHGYWPSKKVLKPKTNEKVLAGVGVGVVLVLLIGLFGYNKLTGNSEFDAMKFENLISNFQYEEAIKMASDQKDYVVKEKITQLERMRDIVKNVQVVDNENAIFVDQSNGVGIIKNGIEVMVEPIYDDILTFNSPDIITVKKDGKCGYIDINGNTIFEGVENFNVCRNFNTVAEAKEALNIKE
jgi:serine/threonine protein kinase